MAEGKMARRSRERDWVDTSPGEIKLLLGILFLSGIVQKPKNSMLFSRKKLIQTPQFYETISEKRFFLLLKFLHFNDNEAIDPNGDQNPRLSKIQHVLDYLVDKFKTSYIPEQDISIDESLLLWKGRLSWKMYIPKKRARFGMESYRLCEASSGYVWNILIYTGKSTDLATEVQGMNITQLTKPSQIVLTLADELLNKGHLIAMDNYYSSPELYQILCQLKTDAVGTVRVNRKNLPADVIKAKLTRGQHIAAYKDKLMCLKWRDKKDVTMLSTIHEDNFVSIQNRRGENIQKPAVIQDYNHGMGGVDLSDQYLVSYSISRKRLKKYYQKMFRHLIDIAMFNSYVLYKKQGGGLSHLDYRLSVVDSLIRKYNQFTAPIAIACAPRGERCAGQDIPGRLAIGRHFPRTNPPSQSRNPGRKRCVVCLSHKVRKDTLYHCSLCEVPLCVAPCFESYHTKEQY